MEKTRSQKNTRKSGRLPARLVHVLLDRMTGRKKNQTRKCNWGGGPKLCREDQAAQKTCRYYDTIASKTPQPKKELPKKSSWQTRLPKSKKLPSVRPTGYEEKTSSLKNAKERDMATKNDCRENEIASKAKTHI